jgi:fibro-slime domain-containing protein
MSGPFFPLDFKGFGKEPAWPWEWNYVGFTDYVSRKHNYCYAMEMHIDFVYEDSLEWTFSSDDDCWLFLNNRLVVDMGGIKNFITQSIKLDSVGPLVGMTKGRVYPLDYFYCERCRVGARATLITNIPLYSVVKKKRSWAKDFKFW